MNVCSRGYACGSKRSRLTLTFWVWKEVFGILDSPSMQSSFFWSSVLAGRSAGPPSLDSTAGREPLCSCLRVRPQASRGPVGSVQGEQRAGQCGPQPPSVCVQLLLVPPGPPWPSCWASVPERRQGRSSKSHLILFLNVFGPKWCQFYGAL